MRGSIDPGDVVLRPRFVGSCRDLEGFLIQGWDPILPECGPDLDVDPRGISRRALTPRAPVNRQSASALGVSTPCGAVSTRGISVFARGLLELSIFLKKHGYPGMRPYPPRVRQDLDVRPRGSALAVQLAPCAPANQKAAGAVGVSTPCGAVSTLGISVFVPGLLEV